MFVGMPIICDEQGQELGFRHLKHKASSFFTYLLIACVDPVVVFSPWCAEFLQAQEIKLKWEKSKGCTGFN